MEDSFVYYRTAAGLTQQDIAERLHLTKENISAWERGKKNIPKKHVRALAELLRVSIEDVQRLNAVRKSNLARIKANYILAIQDQVEKNFPEDDACFIQFRQSMIWDVFQQNWSDAEKTKFAKFIAAFDTGWADDLKQMQKPKKS